jgi:hypothetical protein
MQQQLSIMDGAVHEKVHDKKFECPRGLLLSLFFFFSFLSRGVEHVHDLFVCWPPERNQPASASRRYGR